MISRNNNHGPHVPGGYNPIDPYEVGAAPSPADRVRAEAVQIGLIPGPPPTTTKTLIVPPPPPSSPATAATLSEDDLRAIIDRAAQGAVHCRRWGSLAFWRPIGEDIRRLVIIARRLNELEKKEPINVAAPVDPESLRIQLTHCANAAQGAVDPTEVAKRGDAEWSPPYQDVVDLRRMHDTLRAAIELIAKRKDLAAPIKKRLCEILQEDDVRKRSAFGGVR